MSGRAEAQRPSRAESAPEALTADALDQCRALVQQYVSKGPGLSVDACDSCIVCLLAPPGVKPEEPFMCGSIERLGHPIGRA